MIMGMSVIQLLGPFLAGIGFFFVGVSMVSKNLKLMATSRVKRLFTRFTDNDLRASGLGLVTGLVTQSTSVSAFITSGLVASGLMPARNALPVVFWANAGCALLVFIAVLDIKYVVFLLLFLSGLGVAFERPIRHRYLLKALFGVGLLFFGLETLRDAAGPLAQHPLVAATLQHVGSDILAFVIGAVLTMLTQTSVGIVLIAITLTKAGFFTVDQTIMLIYGANLGSSAITWLLSLSVRGTPKQMIMAQVFFNVIGAVILVPLFYAEIYLGVGLMKALVQRLSDDMDNQMALVMVLFNWVPLGIAPFFDRLMRFLERRWPPTREEDLAKLKFITDLAPDAPATALELVDQETQHLLERLPAYLATMRTCLEQQGGTQREHAVLHGAFENISREVRSILDDITAQDLPDEVGVQLLATRRRFDNLVGLEDTVFTICDTVCRSEGGGFPDFAKVVLEALEFHLLTAVEAATSGSQEEVDLLMRMTEGRGETVERIRESHLVCCSTLPFTVKSDLNYIASLFERAVWLLNRLGADLRV